MKNKRVLITGATSGIGKEIAFGLAALGAKLVLPVRNVQAGEHVAREILARTNAFRKGPQRSGAPEIIVMPMDASEPESVRAFARAYRKRFRRLDVLINNAATNRGTLPRHANSHGIELTFATNVLAYFLLTRELLATLQHSVPARVINVASQFAGDLDLRDLQFERRPFNAAQAYAQSKACDRMLTWAMARRLQDTGVTVNAMTPGLVPDTGLYRDSAPGLRDMLRQRSKRTIQQGADTAIWLASSAEVEGVTNKFFVDREITGCEFRNQAREEKLWRICETLSGAGW